MGLQSIIVPAKQISEDHIMTMLRIMQTYYLNVETNQFRKDLKEKDQVILLLENGVVRGFSTWMLIPHEIQKRRVNIIYSGDTIIEKEHWHSMALPISWGRLMLSVLAQHPDGELYWLLTSKGYKTYRFLPVFFHKFYPSFVGGTPAFEKALMDSFASYKFGSRYDPRRGILTSPDRAQKLAPGVADVTESRRKDPNVAFFEKMNPGYTLGDELVCLALCRVDNIKPFIMRYLKP